MKKHIKKIVLIALVLALLIIGLIVLLIKPAIDVDTFIEKAEENGFTVVEKTEENGFTGSEGFRTWIGFEVFLATHEEDDYQIEFFSSMIKSGGAAAFDIYALNFEAMRSGDTFFENVEKYEVLKNRYNPQTVSLGNYENYSETDDTTFYYVTRVGETVISVTADKEYADEIKEFLDKIGY